MYIVKGNVIFQLEFSENKDLSIFPIQVHGSPALDKRWLQHYFEDLFHLPFSPSLLVWLSFPSQSTCHMVASVS